MPARKQAAFGEGAHYQLRPLWESHPRHRADGRGKPFRFSTQYQDDESELLYYGYRCYNASTGRWLRSDPAGEALGANTFSFLNNDSVSGIDLLGLTSINGPTAAPQSGLASFRFAGAGVDAPGREFYVERGTLK